MYRYIDMSSSSLVLLRLFEQASRKKLLRELLDDLFTPAEIEDFALRWRIIQELHSGAPQRSIAQKLHVSLSKITRGSRVLLNNRGAFTRLLHKK